MIQSTVETITPEIASRYLEQRNKMNRNLSRGMVAQYADDMRSGRWKLTGQPIIFDKTGMLIDGHHRLEAAIQSGSSFTTSVVRGADTEAVYRVDTGLVRTTAQIAHMSGESNAAIKCAILNLILMYEKTGTVDMKDTERTASKAAILDSLPKYPILDLCVEKSNAIRKFTKGSVAGFCFYVFYRKDPDLALKFYDQLEHGTGLGKTDPAFLLRERLIGEFSKPSKLPRKHIVAFFFKAWNAFRKNKPMTILRWRQDEEEFPTL